jgi:hypothetical protein
MDKSIAFLSILVVHKKVPGSGLWTAEFHAPISGAVP